MYPIVSRSCKLRLPPWDVSATLQLKAVGLWAGMLALQTVVLLLGLELVILPDGSDCQPRR